MITVYDIQKDFRRYVTELFQHEIQHIPAFIEDMYRNSKIVTGKEFFIELVHTVPFDQNGCRMMPAKRDAIYDYCKKRIEEIKQNEKPMVAIADPQKISLDSILSKNAFQVVREILDDLGITINSIPKNKFKLGLLTGAIVAIKETPGMLKTNAALTDEEWLQHFNNYLGTSYKTFSKRNQDYPGAYDDAKRYIKLHFKK